MDECVAVVTRATTNSSSNVLHTCSSPYTRRRAPGDREHWVIASLERDRGEPAKRDIGVVPCGAGPEKRYFAGYGDYSAFDFASLCTP